MTEDLLVLAVELSHRVLTAGQEILRAREAGSWWAEHEARAREQAYVWALARVNAVLAKYGAF